MKFSSALICALALAGQAHAAQFPSSPVHLVVPLAPGGTTDMIARMLAEKMAPVLGQPVVVENKGGAGGTIASNYVAKSQPDGYTILMGTIGTMAIAPAMYSSLPYDPDADFAPISKVSTGQFVLAVNPAVKASNLAEFIALARKQPGMINYGSAGNGSTPYLGMELLKQSANIDLVHVPYKGSVPMVTALVAGEIQAGMPDIPSALPFLDAGRLRAIAVTGPSRSSIEPDVPTVEENGFKDFSVTVWLGMLAPSGTPDAVIGQLNHAVRTALQDEELKKRLEKIDAQAAASTPQEFGAFAKSERAKWQHIVETSGARIN